MKTEINRFCLHLRRLRSKVLGFIRRRNRTGKCSALGRLSLREVGFLIDANVIHQHALRKHGARVRIPRQSPPTARFRIRKNGLSKTHFHPGLRSARVRRT